MKIRLSELRKMIREEAARAALLEGYGKMKAGTMEDVKKLAPQLHTYVTAAYRNDLGSLEIAIEGGGFMSRGKPYVYIPSENQAVSWSKEAETLVRHSAPTLLSAIRAAAGE